MNKVKLIAVISTVFLLSACMSLDYPCPLHDKSKACLSELAAYRDSQKAEQATKITKIKPPSPYVVVPLKPSLHEERWFSWRGPIEN